MNRHRFEPARLLLGLLLIAGAAMFGLDAVGEWEAPLWARLAAMPVALTLAAFTAWTTFAVRRHLRRKRARSPLELGEEPADGRALGAMPVDDLRAGYARSADGEGSGGGGTG
ncbi:hypothetical protein GCM10012287_37080 [Streptomyces daqingensis]|uniref:Uncharacterized protein n=1 Tax=Streptomyces daqingensis TaxID=1472640 RepID=A0ABQ2MIU2_9ACTN|nr:hypothetical protein [Streptomyces daqingensis]GGO52531.1 hypothetical protein GCM10012287_37080 [Streptomyces daqingensis]